MEWVEILYVGLLSTGVGYTLQIIGQSKAQPASAAILLSMESVFATLAGWFILNQFIDNYKIFGCCCIFCGVIFVHISPIFSKKKLFYKK